MVRMKCTFPTLLDPDTKVIEAYGIPGPGVYLVFDRAGRPRYRVVGAGERTFDALRAQVAELAAEPATD